MNRTDERREFQRLELRTPVEARLGDVDGRIVELGILGARVELDSPVAEKTETTIRFKVNDTELSFDCVVARLPDPTAMSHSQHLAGLLFTRAHDNSDERLRNVLTTMVREEIERIRPAQGAETASAFDPEKTAMRIPAPFVAYRFENGLWQRRGVFIPSQPANGFTVPADDNASSLHKLCSEYQSGSDEARHLLRLFAELRVCKVIGAPPKG